MQERLNSEVQDLLDVAESQRLRRLARVPFVPIATDEDIAKVNSPSVQMAQALTGKQVYPGTVFGAEKAGRRAKGKRQRNARKLHRGNKAATR